MRVVTRTEALARKLAYDRYDDGPDRDDLARVEAGVDAVCVDLALCSWCGEAPDENDGYCDDCTEDH